MIRTERGWGRWCHGVPIFLKLLSLNHSGIPDNINLLLALACSWKHNGVCLTISAFLLIWWSRETPKYSSSKYICSTSKKWGCTVINADFSLFTMFVFRKYREALGVCSLGKQFVWKTTLTISHKRTLKSISYEYIYQPGK